MSNAQHETLIFGLVILGIVLIILVGNWVIWDYRSIKREEKQQ